MNNHRNIHSLLREHLSVDNSGIPQPDPLLAFEARQAVLRRKPRIYKFHSGLFNFLTLLRTGMRPYQVGFSALTFALVTFCIMELSPDYRVRNGFSDYSSNVFSISDRTISVTSSTMLTSIPTLVIRN